MAAMGKLIARLLPDREDELVSCIMAIFSFTTPRDICRLSIVSKLFKSVAYSDDLWNKFLPKECHQIVSRADPPVPTSKRELYARLVDSILIDGGTKMAWLERSTAKMGYMLSARDLSIIWGDNEQYWRFVPGGGHSRFQELAELIEVCWFEIGGQIDCGLLSPNTNYRVVLVLKFGKNSDMWCRKRVKFTVTTPGGEQMELSKCLKEDGDEINHGWKKVIGGEEGDEKNRGWKKVIGGEFTARPAARPAAYDDDDSHIEFSMAATDWQDWKHGLLIEGVRIEPK